MFFIKILHKFVTWGGHFVYQKRRMQLTLYVKFVNTGNHFHGITDTFIFPELFQFNRQNWMFYKYKSRKDVPRISGGIVLEHSFSADPISILTAF